MEPQDTKPSQNKPTKGYGKRPMWQWIILYIVVGLIVYGAIYYFMAMNNGSGGGY